MARTSRPTSPPFPRPSTCLPDHLQADLAIGTCCRIVPDKRIEYLIDMMKIVEGRLPRASLTIVGGPDSQSLEYFEEVRRYQKQAGVENVVFAGWQERVDRFLAQFAVFVAVSERQGCCNSTLEAMAMGIPVVANSCAGMAEQIEDGANGYLIDSPAEMAARVMALLTNKRNRKKMGRVAAMRVFDRFSMDSMVDGYVQVLEVSRSTTTGRTRINNRIRVPPALCT